MIKIRIKSAQSIATILTDNDSPALGQQFVLPGNAHCRLLSGNQKGIDAVNIVIFVLENIEALSSGLLSAYLYEKLNSKKVDSIEIDGKSIPMDKKSIEDALNERKKQHNDKR